MIQLQFLNYLLETRDSSVLSLNNITEEFFSSYTNEYRFIKEHLDKYGVIPDQVTFLDMFPNFDIVKVTDSQEYLINKLHDDRNVRKLTNIFNRVKKLVAEKKVNEAVQLYLSSTESLTASQNVSSVDILQDTSRYEAYVERCENFDKYTVSTGFKELDELIGGGWDRQEELATIVARSNMGKSWLLFKSAVASVEQGLRVGIYSGEMSEKKVGYRVDTLISHISNMSITKGNEDVANEYKEYIDSLPSRFGGCLRILTPTMLGEPAGVSALRAFIERDDLDILFIDQHSLLEDDRHAKSPVEKASNISKDLKNLQVLKKIPIIAVSQQNRTSTEDGIGLEHIAQADRIGQDSTIVIFFVQNEGLGEMHLIKSRESENMKKLTYRVDFNRGVFTYEGAEDGNITEEQTNENIDAMAKKALEGEHETLWSSL